MAKIVYILLATFNGEKYLAEQLDSLNEQTYTSWRLWVHDDNSTDSTVSIIRNYKNLFPEKICFIDDEISTGGAKQNFSYLLDSIDSNFDYLMFCDQDDVWLENKIQLTLDRMNEIENKGNYPTLIHTDLKVVDENLCLISDSFFSYQHINPMWSRHFNSSIVQNSVTGCTVMLNKKAVEISSPIPSLAIMHDWWILLQVLKFKGVVDFLNEPTILYRQHLNNDVGAKGFSLLGVLIKINNIKKYSLMARALGVRVSLVSLILLKLKLVLSRL